jgi:hypothetical protein
MTRQNNGYSFFMSLIIEFKLFDSNINLQYRNKKRSYHQSITSFTFISSFMYVALAEALPLLTKDTATRRISKSTVSSFKIVETSIIKLKKLAFG